MSYEVFNICIALKIGKEEVTITFSTSPLAFLQSYSRMKGPKITSRSTVRSTPSKESPSLRGNRRTAG